jgi:hypothetical protein
MNLSLMLAFKKSSLLPNSPWLSINFLSLTNEEYEKTLINYLNTRYKEEFENRPIRDIDKFNRLFNDDDAW